MMRKLTKLREEEPVKHQEIMKRLREHENWNSLCRYSFGEIQQIAQFLDEFEMTMMPKELAIFRSRLATEFEKTAVERLIKTPTNAAQVERDVKTACVRTERLLADCMESFEDEQQLQHLIEKQQDKLNKKKPNDKQRSWAKLKAIF